MSVDIKLKHSSTASRVPVSGDLVNGELALNLADEKVYMKNAAGDVVQVAGPNSGDGEYVKVAGDNMTGNLTLGTDKITLDATDGSAEFAGDVNIGAAPTGARLAISAPYNQKGLYVAASSSGYSNIAEFCTSSGDVQASISGSGSAVFKGDVSIGDSATFLGNLGDAVALLPPTITEQFANIISSLPVAQPFTGDPTTLPADIPTPLKDALVRVTTAGKINLNADGSAVFGSGAASIGADGTFDVGTWNSGGATTNGVRIYGGDKSGQIRLSTTATGNTTMCTFGSNINFNADGSATFAGQTEHGLGVKVSGGDAASVFNGIFRDGGGRVKIAAQGKEALNINYVGDNSSNHSADFDLKVAATPTLAGTESDAVGFLSAWSTAAGSTTTQVTGFRAARSSISAGTTPAKVVGFEVAGNIGDLAPTNGTIGFLSEVSIQGVPNYNFYAEGSAPNYFAGELQVSATTALDPSGAVPYCRINGDRFLSQNQSNTNVGYNAAFRRQTDGQYIFFGYHDGSDQQQVGNIGRNGTNLTINGLTGGPLMIDNGADARNITSTEEIGDATPIVKLLNPVKINGTRHGFAAADIPSEMISNVVRGTADETQAIGTLADYDGTVIETEVTEPSAEELTYTEEVEVTSYIAAVEATYDEEGNELTPEIEAVNPTYTTVTRTRTWTETGTRPVYQGVDQTKLIPLLTKALQEALERIEELESAGASALEARIASLEVDMNRFKAI